MLCNYLLRCGTKESIDLTIDDSDNDMVLLGVSASSSSITEVKGYVRDSRPILVAC